MSVARPRIWLGGAIICALALAYHVVWLARVPPGLDRDAAANGWLALNWLRYGIVPFWLPHAGAPEPLMVWLQSATTALLGPSVEALRSAGALVLALAALAVYLLTLEVASPLPTTQRFWAALFAGILFACNPVVTQIARTGLRATTLPLLSGLFFLFFLRAWRTNARREFIFSGLLLGAAAYTYLAARFLPIVVVVFVALNFWMDPVNRRSRLVGLALMASAALLLLLPQLVFFGLYPAAFWERAQSVTLLQNPDFSDIGLGTLLVRKLGGLLRMLGTEWSGQYNQAARPLLSPFALAGFVLSWFVLFRRRRQPAMVLMGVAVLVMLMPDVIGGDRLRPHELRVIGAFVPIMVWSGIGLIYGLAAFLRLTAGKDNLNLAGALLALLIAGWGVVDWFGLAAPALAKSNYDWFAQPDVALAQAIVKTDQPILLPLNDFSRSIVAYLTAKRITHLRSGVAVDGQVVRPTSERVLLLWPAEPERARVESTSYRFDPSSLALIDGHGAYLMPPAGADVAQLQRACSPQPVTTVTGEEAGALCELDFGSFDFPSQLPAPLWPLHDLYKNQLRLLGIHAGSNHLTPGSPLAVTSYWQAVEPVRERWRYFVHLLNDRQELVAGDDLMPGYGVYETPLWQPEEIVPIHQEVQLPADLPPGRYWIEVGLYDPLTGQRAPVSNTSMDRSLAGPLKVPLQASGQLTGAISLDAYFGDEIALDGYRLAQSEAELQVDLHLGALHQPQRDYTVFLHVEDPSGAIVAQSDAQPFDGQYPTSIWDAGEELVSTWRIPLPSSLPPGAYRLWLGIYDWQTGERLPVQPAGAAVDADRLLLSKINLP